MELITIVYTILAGLAMFFLLFPFATVVLSLLAKDNAMETSIPNPKEFDYGCIITAYKNVEITRGLIHSLLRQDYDLFHIYLVADECDISEFDLEHPKLTIFRPDPSLRLKAKSIIHAIEHFERKHDYCIVFDADNLAHPKFLSTINHYANCGHRSIQGQRTAKNLDTTYACLDSMGEFYKNYIERLVPYLLGSSSVISGSGMAVETELYKAYLASPEIEQGKHMWKKMLQEDKILQNFLLRRNEQISYAWDAIVYDEKVTSGDAVETQRSRWLFSYFQNMPNALGIIRRGMTGLNWNQIYFGLMTISPPLFILLFFSGVLVLAGLFIHFPLALAIFVSINLFGVTILWTLYLSKVPAEIWNAVWSAPLFVWRQITALLKMKDPNKNFKHTEHKVNVNIEDVLKNQSSTLEHEKRT